MSSVNSEFLTCKHTVDFCEACASPWPLPRLRLLVSRGICFDRVRCFDFFPSHLYRPS